MSNIAIFPELHLTELGDVLHVLPAPALRNLAKSLRLNTTNQQKADIIQAIIKHSKKTDIDAFFTKGAGNNTGMIVKRFVPKLGTQNY